MRKKITKFPYVFLCILIVIHIFLLSKIIFFPYPEQFIYSYLTSKGLLPYKQIFDQHFPGLMFFPINFYSLGMTTPEAARVWHFSVVTLTHILIFLVAKRVFKSKNWALLANFLYLIWQPFFEGYVLWIDSFIAPVLLLSLYFLIKKLSNKKLFYSGLFLGFALLSKQVVAPLIFFVFIYLALKLKVKRKVVFYFLGVLIPVFVLLLWVSYLNIWNDFIYWTVTFNLTTFAQMGRKYPYFTGLVKAFPVFGLALGGWVYLLVKRRTYNLVLLGIFLIGSLFFAYARFDFIHLQPTLLFGILILVYLIRNIKKKYLVFAASFYLVVSVYLLIPFYKANIGNRVLFFGEFERKVSEKVLEYAGMDETVFAFGTTLHLYQLTNTLPPGKIFVFQFPWFMKVAEERIFSGIISDPPKVVVRDRKATTGGVNLVSHMVSINKYLENNYKVIDVVNSTEIMIPK